jgi:hypothetical protein
METRAYHSQRMSVERYHPCNTASIMLHEIIVGQAECGRGQRSLAREPGVGLPGNAEQGERDSIGKEIHMLHLYQSSLCPFPDFPDFANCSLIQSKEYSVAYKSKASVTYIKVMNEIYHLLDRVIVEIW